MQQKFECPKCGHKFDIKKSSQEELISDTLIIESVGHKYKKYRNPFCAIVDDNLEVIQWLDSIKTERSGSYTYRSFELTSELISKRIMTTTDAKNKWYAKVSRENNKIVLIEKTYT